MTLAELLNKLASQDLYLIRVQSLRDRGFTFVGTLDEYIAAAKTLGAKSIFVSTESIAEEDFIYSGNSASDEYSTSTDSLNSHSVRPAGTWPFPTPHKIMPRYEPEDDDGYASEVIDLCSIDQNLSQYRNKIGEVGRFEMLCSGERHSISFSLVNDWMEDFEYFRSKAEDSLDAEFAARRSSKQEEQARILEQMQEQDDRKQAAKRAERENALRQLQGLVSDKRFIAIGNQGAMLEYAKKILPGLQAIFNDKELKREIRTISAKIKADRVAGE